MPCFDFSIMCYHYQGNRGSWRGIEINLMFDFRQLKNVHFCHNLVSWHKTHSAISKLLTKTTARKHLILTLLTAKTNQYVTLLLAEIQGLPVEIAVHHGQDPVPVLPLTLTDQGVFSVTDPSRDIDYATKTPKIWLHVIPRTARETVAMTKMLGARTPRSGPVPNPQSIRNRISRR